jgi:hypothetical protein
LDSFNDGRQAPLQLTNGPSETGAGQATSHRAAAAKPDRSRFPRLDDDSSSRRSRSRSSRSSRGVGVGRGAQGAVWEDVAEGPEAGQRSERLRVSPVASPAQCRGTGTGSESGTGTGSGSGSAAKAAANPAEAPSPPLPPLALPRRASATAASAASTATVHAFPPPLLPPSSAAGARSNDGHTPLEPWVSFCSANKLQKN